MELKCARCAAGFRAFPCDAGRRRFCSLECKYGPTPTRECPTCGDRFRVRPNEAHRRIFCSVLCRNGGALQQRLKSSSEPRGECVVWVEGRNTKGYGVLSWDGRKTTAHRLAWASANGPIPATMHVLHRCDNPPCVNPAHLFLGTNADNVADKVRKGRQSRDGRRRALTPGEVREVADLAACMGYAEIGRLYGVGASTVGRAVRGHR